MSAKFNNSGNVGIMGENIVNNGTVVGKNADSITNIDWKSISDEIKILSTNCVDASVIQNLNEAAKKKDSKLIQTCLTAANITRDFLISLGASLLASCL